MIIQLAFVDISYLLNIGGPPIALATWIHHFDFATLIQRTTVSAGRRYQGDVVILHIYHFHQIIFSTCQFRIGGLPIPGNYGQQIHFNHLESAGCRYQGTMGIKFILIISYQRAADTRELWASNSFTSSRVGGPPIPGNYGPQIHLPHLVSAAHRYQGTMVLKFIYLISYRRPTDTRELW